jgi:hypothetical protein
MRPCLLSNLSKLSKQTDFDVWQLFGQTPGLGVVAPPAQVTGGFPHNETELG